MRTCLLILAIISVVSAAYKYEFEEYDEEYEDAKDKARALAKASQNEGKIKETEEVKPIYKLEDGPKLFEKFIKDYDKQYKDEADRKKHYEYFLENLKEINRINQSGASYTSDINALADLGEQEFGVLAGVPSDDSE